VSAAARLFVEDGFGTTTIDGIAEAAGVSRKTVFTAVGGKVELLKLAIDWAVAGDDEPVPLAERPEIERLFRERDPAALLRGWVHLQVVIDSRVAGLYQALTVEPARRARRTACRPDRRGSGRHRLAAQRPGAVRAPGAAPALVDGPVRGVARSRHDPPVAGRLTAVPDAWIDRERSSHRPHPPGEQLPVLGTVRNP
jgi:AcrR family transcriptional regulator